jgi:isopropylmalate/homocitrate/citramalate synthase
LSDPVTVYEVGPRDGLQNEPGFVPTATKVALIDLLSDTGLTRIEAVSFVSPKWVPQMADAAEVMAGIRRRPGVRYAALAPNLRGFEAARAAGADEVAVFASASEGFSRPNINCSIAESLERFAPIAEAARADGMPLRGYVSCATDCPYEGRIDPSAVGSVTESLFGLGCREVSLADTVGRGTPNRSRGCCRRCSTSHRPTGSRAISTTPSGGRSTTSRSRSTTASGCSTPPAAVSAAARSRRARREMCRRNGSFHGWRRRASSPVWTQVDW